MQQLLPRIWQLLFLKAWQKSKAKVLNLPNFHRFFQFLTSLDQTILRWWSCKSSVICSRCFRRTYLRRLLPTMQTFLSLHRSLYHWAHLSTSRSGSLRFGCSTTFPRHLTRHLTRHRHLAASVSTHGPLQRARSQPMKHSSWRRQMGWDRNSNSDYDLQLETGWNQ